MPSSPNWPLYDHIASVKRWPYSRRIARKFEAETILANVQSFSMESIGLVFRNEFSDESDLRVLDI